MSEIYNKNINKKNAIILLIAILFLGSFLRFYNLGYASIWYDEAVSWDQSRHSFYDLLIMTFKDNTPPLHNFILFFVIHNFGDSEFLLRLPSALFGAANIIVIYWVGNLFANRNVALISSFLLAISGFHIWYSQEARSYTLLCLISTIVVGSIVKILQGKSSNLWIFLSSFFSVLLLYSHVYGSFLYASLLLAMFIIFFLNINQTNSHIKKWLYVQTITIILFIPAAIFLIKNYVYGISKSFWIPKLSYISISNELLGISFQSHGPGPGLPIGLLLYVFLLIYFLNFFKKLKIKNFNIVNALKENTFQKDFLLLTWFFGPLTIAIIISMLGSSILHHRYLICILPALIIIASIIIDKLRKKKIINFVFILISVYLLGTLAYLRINNFYVYKFFDNAHDNRSAVSAYKNYGSNNDCILIYKGWWSVGLLYYLKDPPKCFIKLNDININSSEIITAKKKKETFWFMITAANEEKKEEIKNIFDDFKNSGWKITTPSPTATPIYRLNPE
jgi:uncharacterized membrane protein